ncbi:MAG: hypothetical protein IKQ43_00910 [Treponema sp.]|nr:hypothetical protein [Treponema sp.]
MNKKVILLAALAFCVGHFFALTQEDVVQKLPDGIDQKSIISFRKNEGNQFDYFYKEGNSYFIHSCGKKIGPFKSVPRMIFSGDNLAYAFTDENEKWHVVLNEKELGIYEELYYFGFMPDPDKYTFHAKKDDGWYIITEEKSYGPFDNKTEFILRKKNGSMCYCIQEEGFDYVYTDGEKRGPFNFVDTNGFFIREVESFIYSWADIYSSEYHLCIDGKDSEAYNSLEFFPSDDGRLYYIYETVDFKRTLIMCDDKILKELDASEYGTAPCSSSSTDSGLCISLGHKLNYDERWLFLLKDGEIKAELKIEAVDTDHECPLFFFHDLQVSCPAGKFGPYQEILEVEFDRFGRAFWVAREKSEDDDPYSRHCGVYIDGKLIYESDRLDYIFDFDTLDDKFIIIAGYDFDVLIVNGRRYDLSGDPTVLNKMLGMLLSSNYPLKSVIAISPRLLPDSDDFIFSYYTDDYTGDCLFHDGSFYKADYDEEFIYYIDGDSLKKIDFN